MRMRTNRESKTRPSGVSWMGLPRVTLLAVMGLASTAFASSVFASDVCNCKGYAGPGGPCYSGPGGQCYSGPGGPCYSGPGGTGENCPSVCK